MKGLNVMFNSEQILQKDIFDVEDSDRQERLDAMTTILKNRFSRRYDNCRFFFSLYPDENQNFPPPQMPKRFQWIHLNTLCFDNQKKMKEFDEEFRKNYIQFLNQTSIDSLKTYDKDIYFNIQYKSNVERTFGKFNQIEDFHDGYLKLNEDGVMVSILNVNCF